MKTEITKWQEQLQTILREFDEQVTWKKDDVFVVGCSTSEIIGEKIGTAGTIAVAEMIYSVFKEFADGRGIRLAFQSCEHINRTLIIERETACLKGLDEVGVVPVQVAGGAMATYAYGQFHDPVVVEFIKADAGIDIGDTFIGMHIKHVAVPIRASIHQVGQAHVTLVKTRLKLIGGVRAVYSK